MHHLFSVNFCLFVCLFVFFLGGGGREEARYGGIMVSARASGSSGSGPEMFPGLSRNGPSQEHCVVFLYKTLL